MKEFRKARGVTERYSSLEEFREARATKPNKKQVEKEQTWKEKERESFASECPVCKQKLTYIYGTNVCACKNPECKGYKIIASTRYLMSPQFIYVDKIMKGTETIFSVEDFRESTVNYGRDHSRRYKRKEDKLCSSKRFI